MKKFLILITALFLIQSTVQAVVVYSDDGKYGLKDGEEIVVRAKYQKLIKLGDSGWIIQERNKFGVIDNDGNKVIPAKYRHVERVFGKFVKLGNEKDFGLYDEYGNIIIEPEYMLIEPLFGKKFLTRKDFKYGVCDENGKILIKNEYEDIYMPNPHVMRIKHQGKWYEIEKMSPDEIILPEGVQKITINDTDFKVTHLITKTGVISGYSVVTATDYLLKIFSSISPAYEDTIDDLMFSKGADTVNIFVKLGWIPRFPFTYARKYYNNLIAPNSGPLSDVKEELKNQI